MSFVVSGIFERGAGEKIEPTLALRALGTVIAVTVTAALVSGRTIPFAMGGWLLTVIVVRAFSGRGWRPKISLSPAVLTFAAFLIFAALSSFWALAPMDTLAKVALASLVVFGTLIIVGDLEEATSDQLAFMSYWFVIGFAIGLAYLTFEVLSDQAVKRWLFNTFTFIKASNDQKYYRYLEGRIVSISAADLNRSISVMNMLFWPVLLCVSWLWSGLRRMVIIAAIVLAAAAATYSSIHETAMITYVVGFAVYALARLWPSATRKLLIGAWAAATFVIIPIAIQAFNMDLHRASWLPASGQDRIVIWRYTAGEALKSPIVGVGARSTYNIPAETRAAAKSVPKHRQKLTTSLHAHNNYLQTWYELGAIGATLFFLVGYMVLRRIESFAVIAQPQALAAFSQAMIVGGMTWGMWQTWYIAMFALIAACSRLTASFAMRAQAALHSEKRRQFVGEIKMWSKWGLIGAAGTLAVLSFFVTLTVIDSGGAERSGKAAQELIKDLVSCRKANRADCATIAGDLAQSILDGSYRQTIVQGIDDGDFFEMSGKSKFGVYLRNGRLFYVRTNCKKADIKVDLFSLNFYPKDVSALPANRRKFGFTSRDFLFSKMGYRSGKYCLAMVELPSKGVRKIVTGQYQRSKGLLWNVSMLN